MKAFPSYVQAYSKHQASFIFRITELDIPAIAYSWGLLKLPRMPELKSRDVEWDEPAINVFTILDILTQWETYEYTDPQKETARKTALKSKPELKLRKPKSEKGAWSVKTAQKEKKDERKEKRKMIKDKLRKQREQEREELGEMSDELDEDWKELRRAKKRAKLTKGRSKENGDGELGDIEIDL